jgi:hypothetical protein
MCVRDDRSNFSRFTLKRTRTVACSSRQASIVPRRSGKTTLTPKGRSDSSRSRLICRRTNLAGRLAVPSTPSPPAFETAAANSGPAADPIPAERIGCEIPRVRQSGVQSMILRLPPSGRTRQPSDARIVLRAGGLVTIARRAVTDGRPLMADSRHSRNCCYVIRARAMLRDLLILRRAVPLVHLPFRRQTQQNGPGARPSPS